MIDRQRNKITFGSIEIGGIGHWFDSYKEMKEYYMNFHSDSWKFVIYLNGKMIRDMKIKEQILNEVNIE